MSEAVQILAGYDEESIAAERGHDDRSPTTSISCWNRRSAGRRGRTTARRGF